MCWVMENLRMNKILFIADKLDPSRGYDSSEQIELCKMNLDLGFKRVKKRTTRIFKKRRNVTIRS